MNKNFSIGRTGEKIASEFLEGKGYKILEKGFRTGRWGELDIICEKKSTLVFVEVKTRTSRRYGLPEESIKPWKQKAIKRAAYYYCKTHNGLDRSLRIDVISILLDAKSKTPLYLKHYKNAF